MQELLQRALWQPQAGAHLGLVLTQELLEGLLLAGLAAQEKLQEQQLSLREPPEA